MLAILAAATVALAATPSTSTTSEAPNPSVHRLYDPPAGASRCKTAGRLQTSLADPALLYRNQDRDAGRLRRLIDLPMGEMCLLASGGARQGPKR